MLEAIRSHAQGWLAKLILALITLPFAFWGIDSYFNSDSRSELVAEVGDSGVTRQDFTEALKEQAERMRQVQGPNFDQAATETREFREQVLNGLAEKQALLQEAQAAGLQVSDLQIATILHQIPAFQEDGKFSERRYKTQLGRQGFTQQSFERLLRQDILLQIYQQPLAAASMVSASVIDRVAAIAGQRREISWADISPAAVARQINIGSQDIQRYYDEHKKDYTEPEAVRIEYAVLSLDNLAAGVQLSEQQVQEYYKANAAKLGPPEERRASHILVAAAAGDAVARKQAKAKAESLLAAVGKAPQNFAELAKRESQDPGSAQQGGSLGSFSRGMMVKPFEDAVFSMKPGEMRLVETEYGFHIIRLDGIKSSAPSLAAVRPQIEMELRKQQAQKQFAEAAENFSNLVYEKAASLKPAADALKLTIQTSDWMTRKGLPVEPLNAPKLLESVFAKDSIKSRQNIEPLEIARNVMVAVRVVDHRPETQKPLLQVSDAIQTRLLAEETARQTSKLGQQQLAELQQGKEPAGLNWSAFQIVGRQQPGLLDQTGLREVMRTDATKLPAYVGTNIPGGGYRIVRITRVLSDSAVNPALRSAIEGGLRQAYARADVSAQTELAKSIQKIEIKPGILDKKD